MSVSTNSWSVCLGPARSNFSFLRSPWPLLWIKEGHTSGLPLRSLHSAFSFPVPRSSPLQKPLASAKMLNMLETPFSRADFIGALYFGRSLSESSVTILFMVAYSRPGSSLNCGFRALASPCLLFLP